MSRDETKIFLNTWGNYNDGNIGYGWFTPDDAEEFIMEDEERDGGEWFVADIDNYLGIEFENLNYQNVFDVIEQIRELENYDDDELEVIQAIMEYSGRDAVDAANSLYDYTYYKNKDQYFSMMDDEVAYDIRNEKLRDFFDWDAYHDYLEQELYEAYNGIVILVY